MRANENDILNVIDKLYGTVADPDGWQGALDAISQAIGIVGAVILPFDNPEKTISSTSLLAANQAYTSGWTDMDTRSKSRFTQHIIKPIVTDADILSRDEMARDPFYQDFLRKFGLEYFAAFVTASPDGSAFSVSVQQALGQGPLESEQLALLAKLGPHAARALSLSSLLEAGSTIPADVSSLISRLNCGAIVLSRDGRVAAMNGRAERLAGSGFVVLRGHVVTSSRRCQSAFDKLASAALNNPLADVGTIALPRPDRDDPLLVQVVPLASEHFHARGVASPRGALVLLFEFKKSSAQTDAAALRALGLTASEARVANLVGSGMTPREASEALGIGAETVRTHLKHINSKLGLRRQSELARLVAMLQTMR